VSALKLDLESLQRELDSLSANSAENEVTRKSITQFRDELAQATSELQELQRRAKGVSVAAGPQSSFADASTASSGSFVRLAGEGSTASSVRGAEMQPVAQRSMLSQQQQMMRDFDEPLAALEGTVGNLQQVSSMIRGEIQHQNRLLDGTNEAVDRVSTRMSRARTSCSCWWSSSLSLCTWCCPPEWQLLLLLLSFCARLH
ncbi:unnamed protein product, partial [Polarella glacialis]